MDDLDKIYRDVTISKTVTNKAGILV